MARLDFNQVVRRGVPSTDVGISFDRPAIIIAFELEKSEPGVYYNAPGGDEDLERMARWIGSSDERLEILARVLRLGGYLEPFEP